MISLNIIITKITQKAMAKVGFGRRFHDLIYFEVGFIFLIFLEYIINLRATLQKSVGKCQLTVI